MVPRAGVWGGVDRSVRSLIALFFPPRCGVCVMLLEADSGGGICPTCTAAMRHVPEPRCIQCGQPFPDSASAEHRCMRCLKDPPHFDRVRSVFVYEEPVQSAILDFKFHGRSGLRFFFSETLLTESDILSEAPRRLDAIVPVPLHRFKLIERGYNQTALLAEELSRAVGVRVERTGLRKVRRTPPQSSLPREERERSLRGAFQAERGRFDGRRILMVDDVMTTGATLSECARTLKAAGAARVEAVTVARAL